MRIVLGGDSIGGDFEAVAQIDQRDDRLELDAFIPSEDDRLLDRVIQNGFGQDRFEFLQVEPFASEHVRAVLANAHDELFGLHGHG